MDCTAYRTRIQPSMTQQTLSFDYSPLPGSARTAMEKAERHADEAWKKSVAEVIEKLARERNEITVDDVVTKIEAMYLPAIRRLDALGPAMKRACKAGVLRFTGRVQRSTRPEKHGRLVSVWESARR